MCSSTEGVWARRTCKHLIFYNYYYYYSNTGWKKKTQNGTACSGCKRLRRNLPRSISLRMCSVCPRRGVRPITTSREYLWRQKSRFAVAARLGSSWTSLSGTRLDAMLEKLALGCDVIEEKKIKAWQWLLFLLQGDDSSMCCAGMQPCRGWCVGRGWIMDDTL